MNALRLFILREEKNAQALWSYLKSCWRACAEEGKPLAIEVKPYQSKRSKEQNARYWALLHVIAEQAWPEGRQYPDHVWHEHFKRTFLGLVDLPNGQTMGISTTTLTVPEFAEYMTKVEAYAGQELGVEFFERFEPIGRTA